LSFGAPHSGLVAVGFMPAFKYRQKNSLIVFERGHKAHGYVQTADVFLLGDRPSLRPKCQGSKRDSVFAD